jgi:hypothetical protein
MPQHKRDLAALGRHAFYHRSGGGLTWEQIGAAVLRGETLAQIAGANAAKVERDALAEVRAGLDMAVVKGAPTAAQEARLVTDARDAIDVLMAAKLSALVPSGR